MGYKPLYLAKVVIIGRINHILSYISSTASATSQLALILLLNESANTSFCDSGPHSFLCFHDNVYNKIESYVCYQLLES